MVAHERGREMAKALSAAASKMAEKFGGMFASAVDAEVTIRTKKHRQASDSLRGELAKAKSKMDSVQSEFKPMAARATAAEKTVREQEDRIRELKLTVKALQTQNAAMSVDA